MASFHPDNTPEHTPRHASGHAVVRPVEPRQLLPPSDRRAVYVRVCVIIIIIIIIIIINLE